MTFVHWFQNRIMQRTSLQSFSNSPFFVCATKGNTAEREKGCHRNSCCELWTSQIWGEYLRTSYSTGRKFPTPTWFGLLSCTEWNNTVTLGITFESACVLGWYYLNVFCPPPFCQAGHKLLNMKEACLVHNHTPSACFHLLITFLPMTLIVSNTKALGHQIFEWLWATVS